MICLFHLITVFFIFRFFIVFFLKIHIFKSYSILLFLMPNIVFLTPIYVIVTSIAISLLIQPLWQIETYFFQ